MKLRQHIIAINILAILSSCYKELPKPGSSGTEYHLIPQTVLDYTYFKQGTYWVYQDSATGKLDSQWVAASSRGLDTFSKYSNYFNGYYQYFTYTMYDTLNNTEMIVSCSMTKSFYGYDALVNRDISDNAGVNNCPMFYYPFNLTRYGVGNPTSTSGDTVHMTPFININILGKIFNNAVRINQYDNCYDQETNSYLAKNMGMIKLQLLKEHKTWNLIRYHIIQ